MHTSRERKEALTPTTPRRAGSLELNVYDADFGKLGDFLGCASFSMSQLKNGGLDEVEYGLVEKAGQKKTNLIQGHLVASVSADFKEVEVKEVEEEDEGALREKEAAEGEGGEDEGPPPETKPITLHLLQCGNLAKADTSMFGNGGSSDPYIEVKWSSGKLLHRTKVINDSQDPLFDDENVVLDVPIEINPMRELELYCDVFDKDLVGENEFLGRATFTQEKLLEYCDTPPKQGLEISLEKVHTWNAAKNKLVQGTMGVGFTRGDDPDGDAPDLLKKLMKHAPIIGLRTTVYKAAATVENTLEKVVEDIDEKAVVFEVNAKIMGRYRGRPKWMPGVVLKVNKKDYMVPGSRETYDVMYDHGARETKIPR